jgi:HPt (histidine-containing phosphotransfer) domain-containing protein
MTAPVGFLDFFVLEASDYIEQLDAQLQASGESRPEPDELQRVARALRGSATMAKLGVFAEIAAGVERVGRALKEGALPWDPALRGVLVAAVDDCKLLLRNVRNWSPGDDTRARGRIDELTHYAPLRPATPLASSTTTGHDSYLATESANIGAGLELLATRPSDRGAAANVLRRVRALRGIASVKDHPWLADVLESAELAAHPLELGESTLSPERIVLLNSSASLLRSVAAAIRAGKVVDPESKDVSGFVAALDTLQERESGTERVVPIAELFFHDGGPTLVDAAPNPPTSPAERFRLEVVSQGEHLQRLVADARGARDESSRDRVRRLLRQALRSLRLAAESFGERDVADFVASHGDAVVRLDSRALDSLAEVATLLAQPGSAGGSLGERLQALRATRGTPPAPVVAPPPPVAHTPSAMMTPISASPIIPGPPVPAGTADRIAPAAAAVAGAASTVSGAGAELPRRATPGSGAALGELLERGIRTLGTLPKTPLSSPVALPEQPPVPIDVLLYRGRAAIERARAIRDEARTTNGPIDPEMLAELYDLIDLALTD